MPFIHVRAYPGRDIETQKKAAEAIMKAASQAMGAPETAFTVVYEEIEKDVWPQTAGPIMEQLKDKTLIAQGQPVSIA